jgi:hypothetical protein
LCCGNALSLIEAQDRSISHLEAEIERHLAPFEEEIKRCEQINGVSRQVLHVLMAEIGTDLKRFPDAERLSRLRGCLSRRDLRVQGSNSVDGREKAIALCERLWSKPLMVFGSRVPIWESAIVASKNGEGVNVQPWRWVIACW